MLQVLTKTVSLPSAPTSLRPALPLLVASLASTSRSSLRAATTLGLWLMNLCLLSRMRRYQRHWVYSPRNRLREELVLVIRATKKAVPRGLEIVLLVYTAHPGSIRNQLFKTKEEN